LDFTIGLDFSSFPKYITLKISGQPIDYGCTVNLREKKTSFHPNLTCPIPNNKGRESFLDFIE